MRIIMEGYDTYDVLNFELRRSCIDRPSCYIVLRTFHGDFSLEDMTCFVKIHCVLEWQHSSVTTTDRSFYSRQTILA